jgi:hypothetical protein
VIGPSFWPILMKEFTFSLKWLRAPVTDRQAARFYEVLFWLVVCAMWGRLIFSWLTQ